MPKPTIDDKQYISMERFYTRPDGHVEVYRGDVEDRDTLIKIGVEDWVATSLRHEADVLAHLDGSPHAPELYKAGSNEYGKTYVAMEFVSGDNLGDIIGLDESWHCEALPPQTAIDIVSRVAAADKDMLDRGVFYRDVNLSHIIVKPDGNVAFIDFGSAEINPTGEGADTQWTTHSDSRNGGTWEFMAPEEFTIGAPVSERTAVYRLGVLYHMVLTGELPVPRFKSLESVNEWAVHPEFTLSPLLNEAGQALFNKAFAKEQADRFQTIEELLQAINAAGDKIKSPSTPEKTTEPNPDAVSPTPA